ncbi:hypothetical protein Pr1d_43230 [Bythopirellula goksoeyrii]|uniref:Methylamine utilization protein n=2 Tax=Bythopirellula goksoeyrii TaxID=1400387 RepID=A0A5B9QSU9_9BACT|nr:hypothetical protein Pr1d_43230 [Bythopirellula goksoeyrii]
MVEQVTHVQTKLYFRYAGAAMLMGLMLMGCRRVTDLGPVANAAAAAKAREALLGDSTGGEGGATVVTGTGWATLKGKFVFDGNPPTMPPYNVNKDMAACTINGKAPLQQTLLVDSATKGIANVAIFVRKASRVHESAQPKGEQVLFDQKECVFLTHVFPFVLGNTMDIKNSDPVGHNTNIEGKNSFNQTIPVGETIAFKPQKEEAVPVSVRCSIHPWMLAYFLPRENGYVAVTTEEGSFEIANLPAGEDLEFQVWHESAAGPGSSLVLATPEAKELKWSKKGRFNVKLGEDEVKELNLTVPSAAFGL